MWIRPHSGATMGPDGTQAGAQVYDATPFAGAGQIGSGAGTGEGSEIVGKGCPPGATTVAALAASETGAGPAQASRTTRRTAFIAKAAPPRFETSKG